MKNLLRVLLISVLTLTLVLPLSLSATAATELGEDPVQGYAIGEGYKSNWVGSQITTVSYASWVSTDGQYNGCVQWSSNKSSVTLNSETGVLTFPDGKGYDCKIYPSQTQSPITKGGVYFSMDVLYTPPSEADAEGTNSNFSGMVLSYKAGNQDSNMLCITPLGQVYTSRYSMQGSALYQLQEGWNTIIFYVLPYTKDGEMAGNKVYLTVGNDVNIVPDTLGITQADLDSKYYAYEYSPTVSEKKDKDGNVIEAAHKGYFSELGEMFHMSAFTNNTSSTNDNLSIKNLVIKNLVAPSGSYMPSTENLYQMVYDGYNMSAYVPVAGGTVTIAKGADVEYWKSGVDPDMLFYKPGDTLRLMGNLVVSRATGSDLDFADLIAAYSKIDVNTLDRYTYVEIKAVHDEIVACQEKLPASAQTSGYYAKSETVRGQLSARMTQIANRAWELIDAAAIFNDYNKPIDERVTAFEEVMDGVYDGTYSKECRDAINALGSFSATYEAIYADLQQFNRSMQELVNADDSTDRGTLILGMMENLSVIRRAGVNNFTFDEDLVKEEYSNHMDSRLENFEELESMEDMYAFLLEWFNEYNTYKRVMFGERKHVDVPDQLQSAVDTYNEYVSVINDEMVGATTVAGAMQYNTVRLATMRDMVADIIDKKDKLFGEEEEED